MSVLPTTYYYHLNHFQIINKRSSKIIQVRNKCQGPHRNETTVWCLIWRMCWDMGIIPDFYFYIKVTASLQTQPFHALKSIFPLSSNFMGLGSTNFGQNINQVEKRKNVAFEDLPWAVTYDREFTGLCFRRRRKKHGPRLALSADLRLKRVMIIHFSVESGTIEFSQN